jgi:hypothetical protein
MKAVATPQQKRTTGKTVHRRAGPAPQHKAAMGRPYGLNHVAIGPAETGLEVQASRAADRAVRGQRNLANTLTPAPAASVSIPSRGMPLPATQRAWLEPAFGADLSAVRLHSDTESAAAARAEHAHAFTAGRDIYFGDGCYEPQTEASRHLLAHEVAHVLQQTARSGSAHGMRAMDSTGAGEVQRKAAMNRKPDEAAKPEAGTVDEKRRRKS